tara:strand:+ start:567 stop:797 length:231 start_codon:yes stop_codon:yes gene_type:complete
MTEIKVTIPDDKTAKVEEAMQAIYPIPVSEDGTKLFKESEWVQEAVRRFIVQTSARYEQKKAQDLVKFSPDDTIAT